MHPASPRASSFRTYNARPEVVPSVRKRMAREFAIQQRICTGIVLALSLLTSLGVVLAYQLEEHKLGSVWIPIAGILAGAIVISAIIALIHARKRRFVMRSPATWAIVVEQKEFAISPDDATSRASRLCLRYVPGKEAIDLRGLHDSKSTVTGWVNLCGLSAAFERNVRAGDLVTVLYDEKHPRRIMVVEYDG